MRSRTLNPPRAAKRKSQRSPASPRLAAPIGLAKRACTPSGSSARRRFGFGIQQSVQMHDEIAHLGIVDGALRLGLPGRVGAGIVRIDTDDVDLVEIFEFHALNTIELAAKYQVE